MATGYLPLTEHNFTFKSISKPVTIGDGSSTEVTVTVDLSSDIPTGKTYCVVSAYVDTYLLPYIRSDGKSTSVETVAGTTLTLKNSAGAWGSATLHLVVAMFNTPQS